MAARRFHFLTVLGSFFCGLLLSSGPLLATEKVERFNKGQVDWTRRELKVTEKAYPFPDAASTAEANLGAELAAKQTAWRSYLDLINNIRFNANQTVTAYIEEQYSLKYHVRAILRNYRQKSVRYNNDGSVEIVTYMPFDELFGPVLYNKMEQLGMTAPPVSGRSGFSGIIIDGRSAGIKPALLPKIRANNGQVIFDALDSKALLEHGPLIYARGRDKEVAARVGAAPLVITAAKSHGTYAVDMVLNSADSQQILANDDLKQLLIAGKLAVLVE